MTKAILTIADVPLPGYDTALLILSDLKAILIMPDGPSKGAVPNCMSSDAKLVILGENADCVPLKHTKGTG